MNSSKDFLNQIKLTYPQFIFKTGKKFAFVPPKTIVIGPYEPQFALLLLHELGHATLGHKTFRTGVERLKIESEAWEQAKTIAKSLNLPFDENFAQSQLDSYRDWLHQKTLCKTCGLTCYQTKDGKYHCPKCNF